MPVKIVRPDHLEIVGTGIVLLTAPHAESAKAGLHTGRIVEDAALLSKSYAVIGRVSREYLDANRMEAAKSDFRKSIQGFVVEDGIKYVLDIIGKLESGIEIGSSSGRTASVETINLVREILTVNFPVTMNEKFDGAHSGSIIRTYETVEEHSVETIQLEFGHEERTLQKDLLVSGLADIATALNQTSAKPSGQ